MLLDQYLDGNISDKSVQRALAAMKRQRKRSPSVSVPTMSSYSSAGSALVNAYLAGEKSSRSLQRALSARRKRKAGRGAAPAAKK